MVVDARARPGARDRPGGWPAGSFLARYPWSVCHTYEDYLQLEPSSPHKLEYCDGEIYAMAGGSPEHGALAMQFVRLSSASWPAACRVYSSDVKVRVDASDLSTYPDLSIVCGPIERSPRDANAITNPRYLVEVTSPSTEDYDRGDKLSHCKQLASLQAVVFVSHRRRQLTVVRRDGGRWTQTELRAGETLQTGRRRRDHRRRAVLGRRRHPLRS